MKKILPGVLLSLAIAIIATILNQYVHIIGASVFSREVNISEDH